MDWDKLLEHLNSGHTIQSGSDIQRLLDGAADAARKLTVQLNSSYHNMAEIRELFSQITGKPAPESFALFPPFYTGQCHNKVDESKDLPKKTRLIKVPVTDL